MKAEFTFLRMTLREVETKGYILIGVETGAACASESSGQQREQYNIE